VPGGPSQEPMENDGRGLYPAVDRDRLERRRRRRCDIDRH